MYTQDFLFDLGNNCTYIVLSWMLEDAERTTIGSYGVSGIAMARYHPQEIEHASCLVTSPGSPTKFRAQS